MGQKRLLVFADGTATGGGSGAENLVRMAKENRLSADIVGFVSTHANGGVEKHAKNLGIDFYHMMGPWNISHYRYVVDHFAVDFVTLSGWLKLVRGLNPRTTFNIHPGPLPRFGGNGMHGRFVHEAVMRAYHAGEITHSAVTMHFVTEKYDDGPIFFQHEVQIMPDDTPETLGKRVNAFEHQFQPTVTDMVVNGEIYWDGANRASLVSPLLTKVPSL